MAIFKNFRMTAALATIALCLFTILHRHTTAPHPTEDPVVASVNDTLIHKSDLSILSPPATVQQATGLLVDFTLLDQEAHKKKITVSDADLQQQRQEVIGNQGVKTYAEAAKALGRTPAGLDLQLRHVALLYKLAADKFKSPIGKMFHARGILIRTSGKQAKPEAQARALAEQLQQQVTAGADIAALARVKSDDFDSAPNGGDLGIIQLAGAPNLVRFAPDFKVQKALANAVNTAIPGSLLPGPIKGDLGYWVVQIVSTNSKQRADQARYRQVQKLWEQMWIGRLEPQVMASLRGSAEIEPPAIVGQQPPVAKAPVSADVRPAPATM